MGPQSLFHFVRKFHIRDAKIIRGHEIVRRDLPKVAVTASRNLRNIDFDVHGFTGMQVDEVQKEFLPLLGKGGVRVKVGDSLPPLRRNIEFRRLLLRFSPASTRNASGRAASLFPVR